MWAEPTFISNGCTPLVGVQPLLPDGVLLHLGRSCPLPLLSRVVGRGTAAFSLKRRFFYAILLPVNKLLPYVLTALLALLAGLGALVMGGVAPFGEATLCWQDNGQQVASDFGYVRGVWEGRHTLDWSYACGGSPRSSFHPTFNNLVSPLTWAVAAVPGISAVTGLSLLFLLQLAFLPLGALYYLRHRFPRLPSALGMALALAYAFGGFTLSKYTFLPFLNVALLFPWFVAALDALLQRGRWVPYGLLLTFMLAAGTYFAWMWLLFAAVYAAARTGWRWHSPVRQHTLLLVLVSALALFLAAFSWVPSLMVTLFSARAGEAHFWWNATRAELVPGGLSPLLGLPTLLAALLLLPAWRHLRCSRYALTLFVLLAGLACVSATTLWHLSRPWDFAGRFGYMAEFMLICMAAQLASRLRARCRLHPLVPTVLGALAAALALWAGWRGAWEAVVALVALLTIALCWQRRVYRAALLLLAALASFTLAEVLGWDAWFHRRSYQAAADRVQLAEWAAQQVPQPEGRATSRGNAAVENMAFFTPFDTLSHFTACITQVQEATLARWGYQQRAAVISTEGGTLASDTLLGIRYILSQAGEGAPYHLEENPYYFGVGLMVPPNTFSLSRQAADPLARQQALLASLLGEEAAGARSRGWAWEVQNLPDDSLYYLQQPADGGLPVVYRYKGWPHARWGGAESLPRLLELPPTAMVEHDACGICSFAYWRLPLASLEALKRYGQELPVSSHYAGRRMEIACRSTGERSLLFLPLLWQNGYRATVDGAPAEVQFLDGFVGIAMPQAGEHQVVLVHEAFGRHEFWLSAGCLLAGLLLARRSRGSSLTRRVGERLNTLCRRMLLAVSAVLLLWPLLTLPIGLLWR